MIDVQPQSQPSVQIYEAIKPPAPPSTIAVDNLTRLKGIGPNYARALTRAGIVRFADLALISDAYLRDELGNGLFRQAQRYDWRGQARLAAEGNETALASLKASLPLDSRKS
jgi:predicted flap endonuclease-1-like 5' DNA nuclease